MTNNSESDKEYVPYKEVVKKRPKSITTLIKRG